jgi:hypothetical protein
MLSELDFHPICLHFFWNVCSYCCSLTEMRVLTAVIWLAYSLELCYLNFISTMSACIFLDNFALLNCCKSQPNFFVLLPEWLNLARLCVCHGIMPIYYLLVHYLCIVPFLKQRMLVSYGWCSSCCMYYKRRKIILAGKETSLPQNEQAMNYQNSFSNWLFVLTTALLLWYTYVSCCSNCYCIIVAKWRCC